MTTTSPWHLPLIAVGVGFHLAVAWALFWRYFQARERSLLTWGVAWLVLSVHVLGMYLTRMGFAFAAPLLRDFSFAAGAIAFFAGQVEREGRAFRLVSHGATAAAIAIAAALVGGTLLGTPVTAGSTVVVLLSMGGAAWLSSPLGAGRLDVTRWLFFLGYLVGALHGLAYLIPFPEPLGVRVEIAGHALFSLLFSAAVTWQAWEHERTVRLFSRTLAELNKPLTLQESLDAALKLVAGVMRVSHGWILLRKGGRGGAEGCWNVGAAIGFPDWALTGLHRTPEYEIDTCMCIRPLDKDTVAGSMSDLACVRLSAELGQPSGRHITVPLGAGGRIQGIMVLMVPGSRFFAPADVELLTAMGEQIGLAIDRARAYDEVRTKEEARGRLVAQLITAQEDERRRIARELHDETGQALTALVVNLDFLVRHSVDEATLRTRLKGVRDMAEDTLAEVRRVIHEMRPSVLDDLGLEAALRWLLKRYEAGGMAVSLELSGLERRLPGHVEITIFRMVQEACTNTVKHAKANGLWVRIAREGAHMKVEVQDDGRGFDPDRAEQSRAMGLAGMKERIALAGGTLSIQSAPGSGTRLLASLPLGVPEESLRGTLS
ncbi:MAG TPA: GAF domain-containing sensor histidine kinase [Symbiobacteriaceae bacterium]|nr:GAF domain-containing sensor histidine kinase [Symbiobacteriaceae bacterium]